MGHPPLITSARRPAYRTRPFFIWPSVDTLSLNDGDEWQWSIAITNRIGENIFLSIQVCWSARQISTGSDVKWEERMRRPLKLRLEKSVTRVCLWVSMSEHVKKDAWQDFIDLCWQMTNSKSVRRIQNMKVILSSSHHTVCDCSPLLRPLFIYVVSLHANQILDIEKSVDRGGRRGLWLMVFCHLAT